MGRYVEKMIVAVFESIYRFCWFWWWKCACRIKNNKGAPITENDARASFLLHCCRQYRTDLRVFFVFSGDLWPFRNRKSAWKGPIIGSSSFLRTTVDDQTGKIDGRTCKDGYGHQYNVSFECKHTRNKEIDALKKPYFWSKSFLSLRAVSPCP